ncbi:MAG: acyl-CoA dehydrogenase family protein [Deltaproteobacteria bacterium]|nr:acyl-CoA dehydrogenase family protein [Deltaproteobacteria bacterium]MBI3389060.1 acyl-CoA dehydrogenase family protein [Deltaproteobacteria bacterium]
MPLVLTEEQELLRHSAREFVTKSAPLKRIRALRDGNDPIGFSRELWSEMAKLGWTGIVLPEEFGGAGLGYLDLIVVMEELGRGLMPEPMLSSVLLGGNAILLGGSVTQRKLFLPPLIEAKLLLTLAHHEPQSRYDLCHVITRAERSGADWKLSGAKTLVPDAHVADRLIVSARTAGNATDRHGVTLFVVSAKASGVSVTRQATLDNRNAGVVKLEGATVSAVDVLGTVGEGATLLETVIDRATVGLCAEMLGSMNAAFEMTLDYLRTRTQFGALIGTFQALKHRAAKMFIETELARSAVMAAARAIDEGSEDVPSLVSLAKARCSDAFVLIGNEGVQMHGGIGMTDEHDIGFFLKRARATQLTFGDAAFHRDRYAELEGY